MVFRWFSSSSLTVLKVPTRIGITIALRSYNFCTCNLKSWYLVIFSSSLTLMFWSPGTAMLMVLHSLLSLSVTTISALRCSISLSVWIAKSQSILHFTALPLVHARTICLHISCTGPSVLYFQVCRVSSCIGFQLGQSTNWQYGWHFQFSLCRACIAGTRYYYFLLLFFLSSHLQALTNHKIASEGRETFLLLTSISYR